MPHARTSENPFALPIGAAGLGQPEMAFGALGVGFFAILTAFVCALICAGDGGSVFTTAGDVAFGLLRFPDYIGGVSESELARWPWRVILSGVLVFALLSSTPLRWTVTQMVSRLSTHGAASSPPSRTLAVLFVLVVVSGCALWLALLLPSDSFTLRVCRGIAVGCVVQVACLWLGGAMACSVAEGRPAAAALLRVTALASVQKGFCGRAAVYALPRWLGTGVLSWSVVIAAFVLPVFLSDVLLNYWLLFLGSGETSPSHGVSLPLRVGRIVLIVMVGALALAMWAGFLKRSPDKRVSVLCTLGLVATAWCFFGLPWIASHVSLEQSSLSVLLNLIVNRGYAGPLTWVPLVGICFVGLFVLLSSAVQIGMLFFLYPLATGICTFFVLRKSAEGTAYQSSKDTGPGAAKTIFAAPGSFVFAAGGATALSSLSPRQGWLSLLWLGLKPKPLLLSMLGSGILIGSLAAAARMTPGLGTLTFSFGALVVVAGILPLVCSAVAPSIEEDLEGRTRTTMAVVYRSFGAWLLFFLNTALLCVAVAIGGALGLVPAVGPILWGVCYLFLVLGANGIAVSIVFWIPGMFILPPMVAVGTDSDDTVFGVHKAVYNYAGTVPWTFLGAFGTGLLFSCVPAFLAAIGFYGIFSLWGASLNAVWCLPATVMVVLSLVLSSFGVALTSAFATVKNMVR